MTMADRIQEPPDPHHESTEDPSVLATAEARPDPPPLDLEGIFQRHHGRVFAAAYRVTGSAQDAEDALQTVFLRILKRSEELDLSPSPGAYLRRAAVNAALDVVRARSRRGPVAIEDAGPLEDTTEPDPERRQSDRELTSALRSALAQLTPHAAEIFTLRFLEGVSNKDIAEHLDMTQSAVGVALHRARNQVKEHMRSFVS